MKFADNIERKNENVFIKRIEDDSLLDNLNNSIKIYNISFDKKENKSVHFYSVNVKDLKIGENIYYQDQSYLTYRSS